MNNYPDQPHCALLKKAGWEWKTREGYGRDHFANSTVENEWYRWEGPTDEYRSYDQWLPCPSIGELKERLNDEDIINYIRHHLRGNFRWEFCAYDILKVTADANALAEIWLWANRKEKV